MSNLFFCLIAGTMIGSLIAFFVVRPIFYVGRRREEEREREEDRLLRKLVSKQEKLIATLEEALYLAAISYLGRLDDCRICRYGYMCEGRDKDNVDACIETVMEGWKDEARRVIQ